MYIAQTTDERVVTATVSKQGNEKVVMVSIYKSMKSKNPVIEPLHFTYPEANDLVKAIETAQHG